MDETPRQRFLRNHEENLRLMKIGLRRAEADGSPKAELIRRIVAAWEAIGWKAEQEEETA